MEICVALCTYNGAEYLPAQLRSIAAQSRLPDRLVAVDDVSRDETVEILRGFAREAPFPVRIEVNSANLGYARNFGRAIELAEGEVIALTDQDDVWLETKLARAEEVFQRVPAVGLVFSDAELVDAALRPLGRRLWEGVRLAPSRKDEFRAGGAFRCLLEDYFVTGATLAFRAAFRDLILPIPERVHHDAWIALLIAAVAPVELISEPLILYRQHAQNQIGMPKLSWRQLVSRRRKLGRAALELRHQLLTEARARLANRPGVGEADLRSLEAEIDHMAVRTSLPESRMARLAPIVRELARRRYRGALGGLRSGFADMVM